MNDLAPEPLTRTHHTKLKTEPYSVSSHPANLLFTSTRRSQSSGWGPLRFAGPDMTCLRPSHAFAAQLQYDIFVTHDFRCANYGVAKCRSRIPLLVLCPESVVVYG